MIVYYFGRYTKPTAAVLEKLFAAWMADTRDKVRDVDLACGMGALYGDLLAEKFQFDWRKQPEILRLKLINIPCNPFILNLSLGNRA